MVQGVLGTRTRRALAVLAAAVVLTGGTITTLAAWQEQERIAGTLAASKLHLQVRSAALNGGAWTDVDASPGTLAFTLPSGSALLSPSTTSSSFVEVRAAAGSLGADLSLTGSSVSGTSTLAGYLQYGALGGAGVNLTNCGAGTLSLANPSTGTLLAPLSALGAAPGAGGSSLIIPPAPVNPPANSDGGGDPVGVCLQIAFPSQPLGTSVGNLVGNQSVTPTWTFLAQSRA